MVALLLMLAVATSTAYAQADNGQATQSSRTITGVILDETGEPVIGASIVDKVSGANAVSDLDGKFQLKVAKGSRLEVSFIGMTTQTITIADQTNLDIVLKDNISMLNEVVVMGYGVQKKKLVTGATSHVGGSDLAKLNSTSVLSAMQSQTPRCEHHLRDRRTRRRL